MEDEPKKEEKVVFSFIIVGIILLVIGKVFGDVESVKSIMAFLF